MKKITKTLYIFILLCLGLAGILLRWFGRNHVGIDMELCLLGWTDKMIEAGRGLRALKEFSGDYNMPYATFLLLTTYLPFDRLYTIKAFSILFDFILAGELACYVRKEYGYGKALWAFGLVMASPVSILNSAYLGQCDVIYVAFAVMSFLFLVSDKPIRSMIALAFAFAFKLQAVFILPIVIVLYWKRQKLSVIHLAILPIVWEILCIPAILAGRGWGVFYTCYLNQTGSYGKVYYYYPNLWGFFQMAPYYAFGRVAIMLAMTAMLIMLVLLVRSNYEDYFAAMVWMAMGCSLLLPSMHERYAFLPELVLPVVAITRPRYRVPAFLLVASSTSCYLCSYFFNVEGWPPYAMSVVHLGVFIYLTTQLVGNLVSHNKGECHS